MSYRVRILGTQIFGDNTSYEEWNKFIESQGIEIDEEGCYDGEITDVNAMMECLSAITERLIKERHEKVEKGETLLDRPYKELADFTNNFVNADKYSILADTLFMIHKGHLFIPYLGYITIKDKLDRSRTSPYRGIFTLKDGETIHVHAG